VLCARGGRSDWAEVAGREVLLVILSARERQVVQPRKQRTGRTAERLEFLRGAAKSLRGGRGRLADFSRRESSDLMRNGTNASMLVHGSMMIRMMIIMMRMMTIVAERVFHE